ncbi:MAG: tRNA 2-thiouridine(34) synthase MnmA [Bacillota bacterium]|nr:tRNA 2-thiouridine(34) synthase MnmA [Bacillota bacterium]
MKKDKANIKVMVGLSGGVDSAVALALLKKEGYDVEAAFMRNWDSLLNNDVSGNPTLYDPTCPQEVDYNDAKAVAETLGVKLHRVDFVKEYWDNVFSYFLSEYEVGRTPNPDIFCNKYIKFDAFLAWALEMGADYIATGHYAKLEEVNGELVMKKSADKNKDQTYFLSQLSQAQLKRTLFPLGDIPKSKVREIAEKLNLSPAKKKDSTGICFIGERHFRDFLKNYIPAQDGVIVDINTGKEIGTHTGVYYYTLGQRRGLGIGGLKDYPENKRWYVCKKDVVNNILYVANDDEDEHLKSDKITLTDVNFINEELKSGTPLNVKLRYRQKDLPATYYKNKDGAYLLFPKPYLAVTPGQAAVFYIDEVCLGGAIIGDLFYKGKKIN